MTRQGKNAADIRLVIDALDLLHHRGDYEEFVIASGDSDFTPLLQRIRADGRMITVMAPGIMSPGYSSLADRLMDFSAIEALVKPETLPPIEPVAAIGSAGRDVFEAFIRTRYAEASAPLSLPKLSQEAIDIVPDAAGSGWFGANGFANAITRLELPNARMEKNYLWDEERHVAPEAARPQIEALAPPEPVEHLIRLLDLPRLRKVAWPNLFETLARYAAEYEFSLTEATRWSRDELANTATPVGRPAIGYVVKGSQFGGAPLTSDPPPTAAEIARAFCTSLIDRASEAGLSLDQSEKGEIASWFGVDLDQPPEERLPAE